MSLQESLQICKNKDLILSKVEDWLTLNVMTIFGYKDYNKITAPLNIAAFDVDNFNVHIMLESNIGVIDDDYSDPSLMIEVLASDFVNREAYTILSYQFIGVYEDSSDVTIYLAEIQDLFQKLKSEREILSEDQESILRILGLGLSQAELEIYDNLNDYYEPTNDFRRLDIGYTSISSGSYVCGDKNICLYLNSCKVDLNAPLEGGKFGSSYLDGLCKLLDEHKAQGALLEQYILETKTKLSL